ncbi:ABC transporter substrate-binding protein [Kitasatospora sp. GP82]|uniref:ABC transporter substrate-binding protein n=1 Tax=Kitasatospora sp. GP82 TaxID=3035089 RepID=UPI002475B64C|nr:ABC transporter substrate-binding protein [Kitasatospora sp. GP82]MDH6123348.1 polar amino acid transport system substrate-binding protein [Kitasatospora sp. GP82]
MHRTTPLTSSRAARACVALAAGSLLLTACGGGSPSPKAGSEDLHGKLPDSVKSAGVLRIGSDLNYAPVEFKGQNGEATGLDPDIAEAVGKELGLKVEFVDTSFDKLFNALQAKDFDVAMSALSDDRQRRDGTDDSGKAVAPGVDFVDYFIAGTSILVQKDNPKGIRALDDLCGHTVALQRGTTQAAVADRQTGSCTKLKKPLTVHQVDTDEQALAEVSSGKATADLNDFPVAAYAATTNAGQFQVASAQLQPGPYGIALRKSDSALRDLLAKALDRVIRSGAYDKILAKWNVSAGAAQNAVINGGF